MTDGARCVVVFMVWCCTTMARAADPYSDISAEEIAKHVTALVALSGQSRATGEVLWGRMAGSDAERAASEYARSVLSASGLFAVDVDTWTETTPQWRPTSVRVRVDGDTQDLATAMTGDFSARTPAGGISAQVVDVDDGTRLDRYNLRGRIALVRSVPTWSIREHSAQKIVPQLAARGAVGAIIWVDQPSWPGDMVFVTDAGENVALPWTVLGRDDGRYLRSRLPARASLTVRGDLLIRWRTQNVIGVLPGNRRAREYVVVLAHVDAYFDGANDNGSGVAALLAIAGHYSRVPQAQRRRTLIFAATGAHHADRAGSRRLVQALAAIKAKCALVVNPEHLGSLNPYDPDFQNPRIVSATNAPPSIAARFLGGCAEFGISVIPRVYPGVQGEARPFGEEGFPVTSLMELFPWYHSSYDDLERFRPDLAAAAARATCRELDPFVLVPAARKR